LLGTHPQAGDMAGRISKEAGTAATPPSNPSPLSEARGKGAAVLPPTWMPSRKRGWLGNPHLELIAEVKKFLLVILSGALCREGSVQLAGEYIGPSLGSG